MRSPRTPIYKFGSHIPVLMKVLTLTKGSVLEMGMGFNSTLLLHWMCGVDKRKLVSYENDPSCVDWLKAKHMENDYHKVIIVDDWDNADIETSWDVAFIDHVPAIRRKDDVRRLANYAKYIVLHDTEGRVESHHHYREIFPLFKWQYNLDKFIPNTSVLSNFIDLTGFNVNYEN